MSKPQDDLEAVRILTETLEPFDSKERERIIRWTMEKLGMTNAMPGGSSPASIPPEQNQVKVSPITQDRQQIRKTDIKTFIESKSPKSAIQIATVVAYYFRFEAPSDKRKDVINKDDLVDAVRKADLTRPQRPEQVLVNAFHAGYLDRSEEKGQYQINAVGENLVAMTLPGSSDSVVRRPRKKTTPRNATRKSTSPAKKTAKKAVKKKATRKRAVKSSSRPKK